MTDAGTCLDAGTDLRGGALLFGAAAVASAKVGRFVTVSGAGTADDKNIAERFTGQIRAGSAPCTSAILLRVFFIGQTMTDRDKMSAAKEAFAIPERCAAGGCTRWANDADVIERFAGEIELMHGEAPFALRRR